MFLICYFKEIILYQHERCLQVVTNTPLNKVCIDIFLYISHIGTLHLYNKIIFINITSLKIKLYNICIFKMTFIHIQISRSTFPYILLSFLCLVRYQVVMFLNSSVFTVCGKYRPKTNSHSIHK